MVGRFGGACARALEHEHTFAGEGKQPARVLVGAQFIGGRVALELQWVQKPQTHGCGFEARPTKLQKSLCKKA